MLATALIVFREIFELALVVGVVLAATQGVAGRNRWVGIGVAGGVLGACIVALFASGIANIAGGMGQELLNASILFGAVVMLGWHNIWMSRHGREMAKEMDEVGRAVASGARPLYALAIVVGIAALREGSEIVLFLWGVAASDGGGGPLAMLAGGALGLAGGMLIGLALYLGLLRIPQRYIFGVTSWMILLLSAGMASQGAGFLIQAGWLPSLADPVWDSSWLLQDGSPIARVLRTLIGYTARPAGMQLVFYVIVLAVTGGLMRLLGTVKRPAKLALIALGAGLSLASASRTADAADFKVFHPIVTTEESEIEFRGFDQHYNAADTPDFRNRTVEFGYGVTDWWFTELEFEYEQGGDQDQPGFQHTAKSSENIFTPIPQGTYWVDTGAFLEVEFGTQKDASNEVFAGPLFQVQQGHWLHTLNVIFHGTFGGTAPDPNVELLYSWQTKWLLNLHFQPGIEFHGNAGDWTNFAPRSEQEFYAGPVIFGAWIIGQGYNLKYELGQLYGTTTASSDTVTKFMLEFEHIF